MTSTEHPNKFLFCPGSYQKHSIAQREVDPFYSLNTVRKGFLEETVPELSLKSSVMLTRQWENKGTVSRKSTGALENSKALGQASI